LLPKLALSAAKNKSLAAFLSDGKRVQEDLHRLHQL